MGPKDGEGVHRRFDPVTSQEVNLDMGVEYQERLEELRGLSRKLKDILEQRFRESQLPYGTKKNHGQVLRLDFEIRPPFVKSKEDKSNRYATADDAIAFFFHVDKDGLFQTVRLYLGRHDTFITDFMVWLQSILQMQLDGMRIEDNTIEHVAGTIAKDLSGHSWTKKFLESYAMSTIEGAQAFFEDSSQFIYLSPSVTRNMVRIGLNSLVHTSAERLIQEGVSDVTELERRLYELSEVFLGLQIKQVNPQNGMAESNPISGYLSIGKRVESENVTKSIVSSIVKSALDRSKPKMLGWEK